MKRIVFLLMVLFSHVALPAALPGGFPNIYVFGDSLSDVGNFVTSSPNCLQNGGVNAPVTNQQGGAFPGQLWVNFVFQHYGLLPSAGSLAHPQGNDWAVSGALTLDVVGQIQQYLSVNTVSRSALYAIWAGSNDIGFRLSPGVQPPARSPTPQQVVLQGVMNIFGGISALASKGARQFLVIGIPDPSLTPGAFLLEQQTPGVTQQIHLISEGWNQALFNPNASVPGQGPLAYLKKLYPDIKIFVWNPTPLFVRATANPASFGFLSTVDNQPNNQTFWCLLHPLSNPDDFLFFNAIHPSAHAHSYIASTMINEAALF